MMTKIIEQTGNESSVNATKQQPKEVDLNTVGKVTAHKGVDTTAHSPHDPPGKNAHTTLIFVNGIAHQVKKGAVGYEDVIALAGVDPVKQYDVTFEKRPRGSEKGTLLPKGPHTHIGDGEVFSVVERAVKTSIIVNGIPKEVDGDTISFEEVVKLAFGDAAGTFTVIYEYGPKGEESGSMEPGQIVHIKDKEVFDVSNTYKS